MLKNNVIDVVRVFFLLALNTFQSFSISVVDFEQVNVSLIGKRCIKSPLLYPTSTKITLIGKRSKLR